MNLMNLVTLSGLVQWRHSTAYSLGSYPLKATIQGLSLQEKKEVLARVQGFHNSGFDGRVYGNVIRHHRSFVGRDYKAWAQMALFVIGSYLSDNHRRC